MSKPPAFQFYPQDFLVGTADMSAEEVGVYIRLLCYQWAKGGLVNDHQKLAKLACCDESVIKSVAVKFSESEDGMLRNNRLEQSRTSAETFRAKQAEIAKAAWDKRKANGYPEASQRLAITKPEASHKLANGKPEASLCPSSSSSSSINNPPNPPDGGNGQGESVNRLLPTTPEALTIAEMFSRRPTTAWDEKEVKALRKLQPIDPNDLDLLKRYYAAERAKGDEGIHRRDLKTFLNNFHGELDRARAWQSKATQPEIENTGGFAGQKLRFV